MSAETPAIIELILQKYNVKAREPIIAIILMGLSSVANAATPGTGMNLVKAY